MNSNPPNLPPEAACGDQTRPGPAAAIVPAIWAGLTFNAVMMAASPENSTLGNYGWGIGAGVLMLVSAASLSKRGMVKPAIGAGIKSSIVRVGAIAGVLLAGDAMITNPDPLMAFGVVSSATLAGIAAVAMTTPHTSKSQRKPGM